MGCELSQLISHKSIFLNQMDRQVDWVQTDRHFEVALFKPSPLG